MRILIVEDKQSLAVHLGRVLEDEGHAVTLAHDGEEGLRLGRTDIFDLLILDVMLPRCDGLSIIRRMRDDHYATQTLILSARDTMQDIVRGLDCGADDYLTKPFPLDLLLAKVRASERRVGQRALRDKNERFVCGDLVLHPQLFQMERGERSAFLTRTECALLQTLLQRSPGIVPHEALIEAGWSRDAEVSYDSLYVLIRTLRSKITGPGEPELLHTVRGVGYALRATVSPEKAMDASLC